MIQFICAYVLREAYICQNREGHSNLLNLKHGKDHRGSGSFHTNDKMEVQKNLIDNLPLVKWITIQR